MSCLYHCLSGETHVFAVIFEAPIEEVAYNFIPATLHVCWLIGERSLEDTAAPAAPLGPPAVPLGPPAVKTDLQAPGQSSGLTPRGVPIPPTPELSKSHMPTRPAPCPSQGSNPNPKSLPFWHSWQGWRKDRKDHQAGGPTHNCLGP